MDSSARQAYLEGQILTATPQKLQLMLIEGALRFARQTVEHLEREEREEAFESVTRCREIVAELLGGIKAGTDDLTRRVAGLYLFLFQTLTKVQLRRDEQHLQDVIRILEFERETWQAVCEKMPHAPQQPHPSGPQAAEITAKNHPAATPLGPDCGGAAPGFSMEA